MAQSQKLQCRADDSLKDAVEQYQEREGLDHQTDAVHQLIEVGLREQRSPIIYRWKDRVVEWVSLLSIAAVVVFALGAGTTLFTTYGGVRAAVLLLTLAAVLLAGFESARLAAGMNHIGVRAREAMAALATVVGSGE